MSGTIQVIKPAGREKVPDFFARLERLRQAGFVVLYDEFPADASWSYTSGTLQDRSVELNSALSSPTSDILLAVRGGYGASDLLDSIPWQSLSGVPEKTIVGFSDISALLSALYARLGWRGIHGPMPGSALWDWGDDVTLLLDLLKGEKNEFEFALEPLNTHPASVAGELFGGCFSVLSSLIGTPYFPQSLMGKILFLEDIGENPGRLMRFWNQWIQSGVTQGLKGILLGHFADLGEPSENSGSVFFTEFARRNQIPVWQTNCFGHKKGNFPIPLGAEIQIEGTKAKWKISRHRGYVA